MPGSIWHNLLISLLKLSSTSFSSLHANTLCTIPWFPATSCSSILPKQSKKMMESLKCP